MAFISQIKLSDTIYDISAIKLKNARTLKIGNTGKTFDGTANVTWTNNEIGFLDLVNRGAELADETDINDVGYGNFYSNNSTKSATLINGPLTSAGFRLISMKGYNSSATAYHWQFATTSSRKIYQRYRNGNNEWSGWGSFVLNNSNTAVGSSSLPVYITGAGIATACTPSELFSNLSWTAGTTAGPVLNVTIADQARTATIPSASTSASGIVTTDSQRFRGSKTLEYPKISSNNTRYQGYHYVNNAGTILGEHWFDTGDATNFASGRYYWRQWSPNSTANTSTSGYHETYSLPAATAGLTANKTYEIFTSKSYSTLDSRYVNASGDTMTGDLTLSGTDSQLLKAGSSTSWITGRDTALVRIPSYNAYNAITSMKTTNGSWEMGVYTNDYMYFTYCSDANYNAGTNSPTIQIKVTPTNGLYGAVWNDYAEFRNQAEEIKPGYCVASMDNGQVYKTTEKFQACDGIVSDTFGFSIGETDECKTPLAVAGRVLAYCEGNRYDYHSGDTVCAGPQGKVCKMTREEIREWPDRIIGIVSEIPEYERWGTCDVLVDGRIWIKVK